MLLFIGKYFSFDRTQRGALRNFGKLYKFNQNKYSASKLRFRFFRVFTCRSAHIFALLIARHVLNCCNYRIISEPTHFLYYSDSCKFIMTHMQLVDRRLFFHALWKSGEKLLPSCILLMGSAAAVATEDKKKNPPRPGTSLFQKQKSMHRCVL